MPERIYSEGLVLPDGRKVRVLAYDDDSVRFRVDGTPYVIEEAFLTGNRQDHAIIKIGRRNARATAADLEEQDADPLTVIRNQVVEMKDRLDALDQTTGKGSRGKAKERETLNASLQVFLMLIDAQLARDDEDDE